MQGAQPKFIRPIVYSDFRIDRNRIYEICLIILTQKIHCILAIGNGGNGVNDDTVKLRNEETSIHTVVSNIFRRIHSILCSGRSIRKQIGLTEDIHRNFTGKSTISVEGINEHAVISNIKYEQTVIRGIQGNI